MVYVIRVLIIILVVEYLILTTVKFRDLHISGNIRNHKDKIVELGEICVAFRSDDSLPGFFDKPIDPIVGSWKPRSYDYEEYGKGVYCAKEDVPFKFKNNRIGML